MAGDHRRQGLIFIGVCAFLGGALFLLDQGKGALGRIGDRAATPATAAPAEYSVPAYRPATPAPAPQPTYADEATGAGADAPPPANLADLADLADLERDARTFAQQYFAVGGQDAAQALPWMTRHYADTVRFFGQIRTRDAIIRDKLAYLNRWPDRSYVIQPDTLVVECDAPKGLCRISGTIDWSTNSVDRGKSASGQSSFALVTLAQNGLQTIVSETSRVIGRDRAE